MSYDENQLYHHGIKGQRWGVRRNEAQLARARGKSQDDKSDKNKPKIKPKTAKSVEDMSTEELNAIIKRMELEKRYKDLSPKKVSVGKKFVNHTVNKTIVPAITDATKQIIKECIVFAGEEALGLRKPKK